MKNRIDILIELLKERNIEVLYYDNSRQNKSNSNMNGYTFFLQALLLLFKDKKSEIKQRIIIGMPTETGEDRKKLMSEYACITIFDDLYDPFTTGALSLDETYKGDVILTKFLEQKIKGSNGGNGVVYATKESQYVIVSSGLRRNESGVWNNICSILPRLLVHYKGKKVSQEDIDFLKQIASMSEEYLNTEIEKYFDELSENGKLVDMAVDVFLKQNCGTRLKSLEKQRQDKNRKLDELANEAHAIMHEIKEIDAQIVVETYESRNVEDLMKQLRDYFKRHKALSITKVDSDSILFKVRTVLDNYDIEIAKRGITPANPSKPLYGGCNVRGIDLGDMEELLKAILIDRKLKVWVEQNFEYRIDTNSIKPISLSGRFVNCMPQPHIFFHSCMGGFRVMLAESLAVGAIIPAFENVVLSTKNLNMADTVVMRTFGDQIYEYDCIELPNGDFVGVKKAIEWLKGGILKWKE